MACTIKHTTYQPTDAEWKCPNCGAGGEAFWVEENATEDLYCSLLHKQDGVICNKCEKSWAGQQIANILKKAKTEKVCPYCKGTGKVFV